IEGRFEEFLSARQRGFDGFYPAVAHLDGTCRVGDTGRRSRREVTAFVFVEKRSVLEAAIHGFGWRGPCEYFTRVGSNDLDQVAGQHDCCVSLYRILGVLNAAALHGNHAENADGGQYQGDHHFDQAEASVVAHGDPHNVQLVRAFPSAPLPRSWRMGAPLARTSTT